MVKGSVSNQNFWWHKLAEISKLIFQDPPIVSCIQNMSQFEGANQMDSEKL